MHAFPCGVDPVVEDGECRAGAGRHVGDLLLRGPVRAVERAPEQPVVELDAFPGHDQVVVEGGEAGLATDAAQCVQQGVAIDAAIAGAGVPAGTRVVAGRAAGGVAAAVRDVPIHFWAVEGVQIVVEVADGFAQLGVHEGDQTGVERGGGAGAADGAG